MKFKKEIDVCAVVDLVGILENLVFADSVLESWLIWDTFPE